MKVKVAIVEMERGWGSRVDEIREFDTRAEAAAFVVDYNADNHLETVPDWYMFAMILESLHTPRFARDVH